MCYAGTSDIRPFAEINSKSIFSVLKNAFDPYMSLQDLSKFACKPNGMSWGTDNQTLFYADGHTRDITKCNYNLYDPDVSNCETIFSVTDEVAESAIPKGLATDENNHIWLAVANNEDKGSILEINPDTKSIISSIGRSLLLKLTRFNVIFRC